MKEIEYANTTESDTAAQLATASGSPGGLLFKTKPDVTEPKVRKPRLETASKVWIYVTKDETTTNQNVWLVLYRSSVWKWGSL